MTSHPPPMLPITDAYPRPPLRRWSQREVNGWVPASSDVHVCTPRRGRRPNMRSLTVCRPCLSRVAGNEKDECSSQSHYCIAALTTDPKSSVGLMCNSLLAL